MLAGEVQRMPAGLMKVPALGHAPGVALEGEEEVWVRKRPLGRHLDPRAAWTCVEILAFHLDVKYDQSLVRW